MQYFLFILDLVFSIQALKHTKVSGISWFLNSVGQNERNPILPMDSTCSVKLHSSTAADCCSLAEKPF